MSAGVARTGAESMIALRGVRTNNLQNLDVEIPRRRLTVISGPSGSGKSSLAFDTLYAEGQRRYVESLSAYTRQFLDRMDRPDVDAVSGIPPAIAVERRPPAKTSRSTVGTVTETLDYLRMLYARVATRTCTGCGREVVRRETTQIVEELLGEHEGTRCAIVFPVGAAEIAAEGRGLLSRGFYRVTSDGVQIVDLHAEAPARDVDRPWFAVADRVHLDSKNRSRLAESLEAAFLEGHDRASVFLGGGERIDLSRGLHCPACDRSFEAPGPLAFSFNSPIGACARCRGFGDIIDIDPERVVPDPRRTLEAGAIAPWQSGRGRAWQRRLLAFARETGISIDLPFGELPARHRAWILDGFEAFPGVRGFFKRLERKIYKLHVRVFLSRYRRYAPCPECGGARLNPEALAHRVAGKNLAEVCSMPISRAKAFFAALRLPGQTGEAAAPLREEIVRRLDVMERAGLDYLTLDRPSRTLSGGEYQRILLAGALGSGLVGTLYVLDEPSVGLHARDGERLMGILRELTDAGNTVVVVEHDPNVIMKSDRIIDLGPGAGRLGGRIVFEGPPAALVHDAPGATAEFLSGRRSLPAPARRDLSEAPAIGIRGARAHNLKEIDVDIPLGGLVCVTGVSGSGKSTLVEETLFNGYRASKGTGDAPAGAHRTLAGTHQIADIILVDQSPIGRTPRSNPVTYMKAFDGIRHRFAGTRTAKERGLDAGSFSFNVSGGRCEACEGNGAVKIEMQFLADLHIRCEVCGGTRYQAPVLEVRYRGKTIADVLDMTVDDAIDFFADTPPVARSLWHLAEVGLGYLRLGQPATTLSGGEAQRLKIARYLAKAVSERCLFILDEPTTGLHLCDIGRLLGALERLVHHGHSVLVVEHNLDVIARADHVIDLGPEGGEAGGRVVATGPPEAIAETAGSITGSYLARYFERHGKPQPPAPAAPRRVRPLRPRTRRVSTRRR
jgi:excinuclease ABC subunit A